MEAFERGINKGEKDDMNEAKRNTILSTLNVFFELIMSGIRIRSYHVFKLIKLSLAFTKDEPTAFNNVIAEHIQSLLAHFLPGRKLFAEITRMCSKNFYQ